MSCCANCRWWEPYKKRETVSELDEGECHRYPPNVPCVSRVNDFGIAVYEIDRGSILVTYPVMFALEWCGEFNEMDEPRVKEAE